MGVSFRQRREHGGNPSGIFCNSHIHRSALTSAYQDTRRRRTFMEGWNEEVQTLVSDDDYATWVS